MFLVAQTVKDPPTVDLGSVSGLGRFPGGRHGNSLQYSCLENPHGQRSLAGYSPWGSESQTRLSDYAQYSTVDKNLPANAVT